jgi:hypothetical protein
MLPLAEWGAAVGLGLAIAFAPLAIQGLLPDFLRSLGTVGYGGGYNRVGLGSFARETLRQVGSLRIAAVPAIVGLLWPAAKTPTRRLALPWVAAFAGVLLYRPLSPVPHAYLAHPLMVVWAVVAAVLARMVLQDDRLVPSLRLVVVLLVLGLGVTAKPRFSTPNGCREAIAELWRGQDPKPSPAGYASNPEVRCAARYEWADYRQLLHYLRTDLAPGATVANALKFVPAVAGPAGRLSAFPAESIAWVTVVRPKDEDRFATALQADPRAVVVWSPAERDDPSLPRLDRLTDTIDELYEPHRRFGAIEVWTRKPAATLARKSPR